MSKPMILKENYADGDLLNAFTYSSQLAAAPATNVLAKTRRTKVWRSAGYWNITSSINVIKFKETSGGSVLTATIAAAEYTTDTAFLLAIKTALQSAGASTYTVTRDSTSQKIKITSNGLGGGGAFQLLCTNVGFTAAAILGFSTSVDRTGALTYTADVLKIHTSEWLVFDLGTASNVGAAVLIGLQNEGIQLSSDAVVTWMGNSTNVWTAPQYTSTADWHEDAISLFNTAGFFTGGLRYWKLEIVDASNANGYIEISNIYLGEIYETTQGSIQFPLQNDFVDLSKTEQSETGVSFSNVVQQTENIDANWFGLTKDEFEALKDLFKTYGTAYPFFISLDPDEVFSTDFAKWIKYVRFVSAPRGRLTSPNVFTLDWSLREEL